MSTLMNEPMPQQALATLSQSPTSVQPLPFFTYVVSVFAGVAPQIPGTSQSLGNVFTGEFFHHHPALG